MRSMCCWTTNVTQLDAFVEDYRSALERTLDGLTEEQARRHLVPSETTLLGLLKHVTWMQRVWFEECIGGTSRQELGLAPNPRESFRLTADDSIDSVTAGHRRGLRDGSGGGCGPAAGRRRDRPPDRTTHRSLGVPAGSARLAHHCGHADILREQLLAG